MAFRKKKPQPSKSSPPPVEEETGAVSIRGRFGQVMHIIDGIDVTKVYKEVEESLEHYIDPENLGAVRGALESAARISYKAGQLLDVAEYEYRKVQERIAIERSQFRNDGEAYWMDQKELKKSRSPTNDMVTDYCRESMPTMWQTGADEVAEARRVRDTMNHLYEAMRDRLRSLRQMTMPDAPSHTYRDSAREGGGGEF